MIGGAQISGPKELARFLDYLVLQPDVTHADISQACAAAREHGIGNVCVNTSRVAQACHLLQDSGVKIVAAIGFPLGAMDADAKRYETEVAVDNDAHFIEVVANVGRIKDADYAYVLRELRDVVEAADERPVNVVIEAPLLSAPEIEKVCDVIVTAGAKGIVTSTGFEGRDARIQDVRRVRETMGESFGIKAMGGMADAAAALAMIEAGATRIGVANVISILQSCDGQLA
jgi:deoxyribose-phosphate aldolase